MAGFFEKRIASDIETRMMTSWPGLKISQMQSPYHPDGLILRAILNDTVSYDLTIVGAHWSAILRFTVNGKMMPLDERGVERLNLSVGAAPAAVATEFHRYLAAQWENAGIRDRTVKQRVADGQAGSWGS